MPPGMPWAYGQSMSMRNPMSRAPMNNNPMGNQAPMQLQAQGQASVNQYGNRLSEVRSPGAGWFGNQFRMNAPNTGMPQVRQAYQSSATMNPITSNNVSAPVDMGGMGQFQSRSRVTNNFPAVGQQVSYDTAPSGVTPMGRGRAPMIDRGTMGSIQRTMAGDPIYGQNGIGVQRAAQNVLMQQPPGADTRMRGLNMPGMQFNPSRGAMVQNPRTPLTVNPDQQRWGRLSAPGLSGRNLDTPNMAESAQRQMIDGATQRANTRIARAGRMAGVRAGDMAQWRATSPAALAIARNAMPQLQQPGPPGNVPAQMGEQMAGPPRPPVAIQPSQANAKATSPVRESERTTSAFGPVQPTQTMNSDLMTAHERNVAYMKERDSAYDAEDIRLAKSPEMSAGEHMARKLLLDANRFGSMLGDAYKNIIQGNSRQIVADEEQKNADALINRIDQNIARRSAERESMKQEAAALPVKAWMDMQLARLRGRNRARPEWKDMQRYATTPQPWRNVIYGEERSYPEY